CMELLQHLLDQKIVRLHAGTWVLPDALGALELPASIEQVLDRRIAALSPAARAIAELLSLCTRFLPLQTTDYVQLLAHEHGSAADPRLARGADQTLRQLVKDSGRIYFDETDPTLELPQRVKMCFERAQAAYDATPEAERGLPPLQAISELAICVSTLSAVC